MNSTLTSSCLLVGALLVPAPSQGASCSVSSTGLAFGRYEPLTFEGKLVSTPVTSDATISVACTGIGTGGGYSISLGPSLKGTGDRISTRYLSNPTGGPDLAFNVYRDPGHTSVWGDGITAGATLSGSVGPGARNVTHTVYGRIQAGQSAVRAGTFSTTMTMTISYTP